MNIKELNDTVRFSKSPFFNICIEFFKASILNDRFKPFHIYLFREDLLYDNIVNKKFLFFDDKEKYLTKTGRINYKNKTVKRYIEDYAQVCVGNVYFKNSYYKLKFCPLFITYKKMFDRNDGFKPITSINGYAIDNGNSEDPYFASKAKLIGKMPFEDMNMPIEFATDMRAKIEKLSEMTKNELENYDCI